jgi:SAM-dependent MidA family methyltransferase
VYAIERFLRYYPAGRCRHGREEARLSRESALEEWIREQIEASGPVPFEQFMEWALYHPQEGYYTSGRAAPGSDEGDFTTAPHISALFGRTLSRVLEAADRALGRPEPFVLVEGGAGRGKLARDLLDALRDRAPELYDRLVYAPDEVSPVWVERQEAFLAAHAAKIRRPSPERFRGVYLSNELLDAFPVHRVVRRDGQLREVHVAVEAGQLTEALLPLSRPEVATFLSREGIDVEEGCEVEVNLRALSWLRRVAERVERGYVITIDYGDEAAPLYGPHRPLGTCLAYRRHRAGEDLLLEPGLQDLTAHVNFTALRRAGGELGLESAALVSQREFLFGWGFLGEVEALETSGLSEADLMAARRALAPLFFPDMGETFHVLVQAKGAQLQLLAEPS